MFGAEADERPLAREAEERRMAGDAKAAAWERSRIERAKNGNRQGKLRLDGLKCS